MSSRLLYEKWLAIAGVFGRELALVDSASGQRWTFAELRREGERGGAPGPIVFPQGRNPQFVFSLLRAWRAGRPAGSRVQEGVGKWACQTVNATRLHYACNPPLQKQ